MKIDVRFEGMNIWIYSMKIGGFQETLYSFLPSGLHQSDIISRALIDDNKSVPTQANPSTIIVRNANGCILSTDRLFLRDRRDKQTDRQTDR